MQDIVVWCADIGSIKNKRFGWCRGTILENKFEVITGTEIQDFADGIAKDISDGYKVALGFECPLFIPISENPIELTSARQGEKDRAWSAVGGCGALATGLTETAWILGRIKELVEVEINVTFDWNDFVDNSLNLFIWEAFVSKSSKANTHSGDAEVAVRTFYKEYPKIVEANSVTAENPYNLVAVALLRTGITDRISMLSEACVVIKV